MARPTIDEIRSLGDFAVTNIWDISFGLPGSLSSGTSSADLNFRCMNVSPPKRTGASITTNVRGIKVKQPGDYDYSGTMTLTLAETVDQKVNALISAWRELCIQTKTYSQTKKSEAEGTVILSRLDRQHKVVWVYTVYGVFVEDYDPGTFDENGAGVNVSLTLSYDYFEEKAN